MLELKEYLKISKRIIRKYGKNFKSVMLKNEDAISHVAHFLMMADSKYSSEPKNGHKQEGSPIAFRGYYGRLGVVDWINRETKKKKMVNIDSCYDYNFDSSFLSNIQSSENTLDNVKLNEILNFIETFDNRTKHCFKMYYYEDKTLEYIGEIYNLSKERIRQVIEQGLNKIRRKYKCF